MERCLEQQRRRLAIQGQARLTGAYPRVSARVPVTSWRMVRKLWADVEREADSAGVRIVSGTRADTESRRFLIC